MPRASHCLIIALRATVVLAMSEAVGTSPSWIALHWRSERAINWSRVCVKSIVPEGSLKAGTGLCFQKASGRVCRINQRGGLRTAGTRDEFVGADVVY